MDIKQKNKLLDVVDKIIWKNEPPKPKSATQIMFENSPRVIDVIMERFDKIEKRLDALEKACCHCLIVPNNENKY